MRNNCHLLLIFKEVLFMTLERFLLKNLDKIIYIATEKGSSWLVIEKGGYIIDRLDKLDDAVFKQNQQQLSAAENKTNSIPYDICKILDTQPISEEGIEKKEKDLELLERAYANAIHKKYKYKRILEKFKKPSTRNIVNTYPVTDTGAPGIGVIISGEENGNLWFYGEKGRKKLI